MVQEGTMQTFKGGRQETVLPNYDTYDTCPAMHSNHLHNMKTQSSGMLDGNPQLSNWIYSLINKRATMVGTRTVSSEKTYTGSILQT